MSKQATRQQNSQRHRNRPAGKEIAFFGCAVLIAVSAAMAQVAQPVPEIDVHASTVEMAGAELDFTSLLPE